MNCLQSFSKYYDILNLSYDSDLKTCKRAYKKFVNQWHPDKIVNNKLAQQFAEEKLKEINIAYSNIIDYYSKHQVMPGVNIEKVDVPESKAEQTFDVSSLYSNLSSNKTNISKNSKRNLGLLLFGFLIILIYQVLFSNNEYSSNSANNDLIEATKNLEKINVRKNKFTTGSSFTAVIKIQGKPDFRISETLHYGKSWVLFQNGLVKDWYQDNEDPLNTYSVAEIPYVKKKIPKSFEKGDSKSDVRAIQGAPVRKSRDVWYYQISKVYFKNNIVTSWFNSPLDPLRVDD